MVELRNFIWLIFQAYDLLFNEYLNKKNILNNIFLFQLKKGIFAPQILKVLIMDNLKHFSVPIKGLKSGIHQYHFQIDKSFFSQFENSLVQEGTFEVDLIFDKRPDMYVLTFQLAGTVSAICDRCLESINLPINNEQVLIVKYAAEANDDDADIIYIADAEAKFNVAKYIYEYINLSLPLTKIYDCEEDENAPCNEDMLSYLDAEEEEEETEAPKNSIWDELKNFNKNKDN